MIWILEFQNVHLCSCRIAKAVQDEIMYRDDEWGELHWTDTKQLITIQEFIDKDYGSEYWEVIHALKEQITPSRGFRVRSIPLC